MVEAKNSECVKVVVRCRPLSTKETQNKRKKIVQVDGKSGQITIKGTKKDQKKEENLDPTVNLSEKKCMQPMQSN